jgi:hypothetical protein
MRLYFDERADHAFPSDHVDCYVQAAVMCSDSFRSQAETFVGSRCESWGMAELHAAQMSGEQLLEIADSPIELGVQLTDTVRTTKAVIGEFRLSQTHAYAQSPERYRKGGGTDSAYITDTRTRIKQAGLSSQISDCKFVQATLLVNRALQAVQRCLYADPQDRWHDDLFPDLVRRERITKGSNRSHDEVKLDLTAERLAEQFLRPYREVRPVVIGGMTIPTDESNEFASTKAARTRTSFRRRRAERPASRFLVAIPDDRYVADRGQDVTDQIITGPSVQRQPPAQSER